MNKRSWEHRFEHKTFTVQMFLKKTLRIHKIRVILYHGGKKSWKPFSIRKEADAEKSCETTEEARRIKSLEGWFMMKDLFEVCKNLGKKFRWIWFLQEGYLLKDTKMIREILIVGNWQETPRHIGSRKLWPSLLPCSFKIGLKIDTENLAIR